MVLKGIMKNESIITKDGLKELNNELKNLIDVERPKVIQEIKEAREQGDLSENSEFDAARQRQGQIEDRISEIERIITSSHVIKTKATNTKIVSIGSKIEVEIGKTTHSYQIVGPLEADPFEGKISNVSPLGTALLGKKTGAEISYIVESNKGTKRASAKILSIDN